MEPEHPVSEPPATVNKAVDPEILEIFFEEAQGELANIRDHLEAWRNNPADNNALLTIRRSFHTLKGSGRMVEQFAIGDFAWRFENLLNHIRDGELSPSLQIVDAVDQAQQVLSFMITESTPSSETVAAVNVLEAQAEMLLQNKTPLELPVSDAASDIHSEVMESMPMLADKPESSESALPQNRPSEEVRETNTEFTAPNFTSISINEGAEVDPELVEIFQSEAAEILDASDTILERWKEDQGNIELLNDLRREMHTLKGSSRMAGFVVIGDLAHAMESVLNSLANQHPLDTAVMVTALQQALDRLHDMLVGIRNNIEIAPANDLLCELKSIGHDVSGEKLQAVDFREKPLPEEKAVHSVPDNFPVTLEKELTGLDQELVVVFQQEAAEVLDAGDIMLQRWSNDFENRELLNDLRREMHTLKGSARMAGFIVIGDLAHAMESLLDALGKGNLQPSAEVVNALQQALDGLNDMVTKVRKGIEITPAENLINDLKGWLGELPKDKAKSESLPANKQTQQSTLKINISAAEDNIRVSATLLNKLVNEMGESSIYRARIDQGVGTLRFSLSDLDQTVFRLHQQLRRLEIETEAQILFRYEKGSKEHQEEFDPLELDRFSELQQLSRSLMESVDDLTNIKDILEDQAQEMGNLLDQQAKVNKEIHQGLMQTRMVRFSTIAPRLRRVVRQVAQDLGKRAELVLEGLESEVDRTVLENIVAPLEHMLRNAVSHGIETPEKRIAVGKVETGTIILTMHREGAELVLSLRDDGAGLNFSAIRAKGEASGLLKPGQTVTKDDLIALLLRPGFSTATKVTQISGRGVGMDVLNDAIKAMRGALLIQSKDGQGTTFTIRLPFSLAVTQALLIQVGMETYAVPLLSIGSVARLDKGKLRAYLAGKAVEHEYGEHRYPLHNLGVLLGVNNIKPYEEVTDKRPPVLLFRSAEAIAALQVEAVLSNQEIIVKPLSPQFHSLTGISGATVLGDGRVVLVLELAALVRNLTSQSHQQAEFRALHNARQEVRRERIKAMVIDDSITMRKVTSRFLERHNILVTAAKDGVEAVAKLEEQVPDLVILDIEMPRMDGFEVAAHIRNQPHLHHIPIIMVTSRGGEKHRQRAAKLEVNDYLTKPYQEEEMMRAIRNILSASSLELQI